MSKEQRALEEIIRVITTLVMISNLNSNAEKMLIDQLRRAENILNEDGSEA